MNLVRTSFGGKHGSIRACTDEPQISTDGMLNQVLIMDSTFFFADKDDQFDDDDDLKSTIESKNSKSMTDKMKKKVDR
jgi:hypothetical protein